MNELNEAKARYTSAEIPAELNKRVQEGIRQGQRKHRKYVAARIWKRTALSMAACLALAVAGLNVSPTLARAAEEVPVLGGLFRVLTFRQYEDDSGDYVLHVTQPAVSVEARVEEGKQLVQESKDAFFATGGTNEEWAQRDKADITVTYEIKSQTEERVSFLVDSYINAGFSNEEQYYYNLDLADGHELTLADVLGEDWVQRCNDSIRAQMADAEDPSVYFDESMGGFTTVDESTQFYLNEAGQAVVVFPRATVAIGAMGIVEFVIGD